MYDETHTHHRNNKNIVYLFSLLSLPGQEKNCCIVDFYVVIQCSIWKINYTPEMLMKFLVPIDDNYTKVETVVGPLKVLR